MLLGPLCILLSCRSTLAAERYLTSFKYGGKWNYLFLLVVIHRHLSKPIVSRDVQYNWQNSFEAWWRFFFALECRLQCKASRRRQVTFVYKCIIESFTKFFLTIILTWTKCHCSVGDKYSSYCFGFLRNHCIGGSKFDWHNEVVTECFQRQMVKYNLTLY